MSASGIEWTEHTWNPIVGCSVVSPGCTNCYAMAMAARLESIRGEKSTDTPDSLRHYAGTTRRVNGKAVWTGKLALAPEHILTAPLRRKKPTTYFVNSMGDLFHEDVPDEWIDRVFAVMALCPQHTFQVLTKRAGRMRDFMTNLHKAVRVMQARLRATPDEIANIEQAQRFAFRKGERMNDLTVEFPHFCGSFAHPQFDWKTWPLPNVWLGVSAERQAEVSDRIPDLLATPAAVRFVSAEPLLSPIDLDDLVTLVDGGPVEDHRSALYCDVAPEDDELCGGATLDWVIVGGESGPGARPMHPDWARSIRDQCAAADVPFFFKQWGEHEPIAAPSHVQDHLLTAGDAWDFRDSATRCEIVWPDGRRVTPGRKADWWEDQDFSDEDGDSCLLTGCPVVMRRVGKGVAGRLLDGREHNAMPGRPDAAPAPRAELAEAAP